MDANGFQVIDIEQLRRYVGTEKMEVFRVKGTTPLHFCTGALSINDGCAYVTEKSQLKKIMPGDYLVVWDDPEWSAPRIFR